MNRLTAEKQVKILRCIVEGNSLRSTSRITGHARETIAKLLRDLGGASEKYHKEVLKELELNNIQMDEIWSFVGCKQKNKDRKNSSGYGSAWTWVAFDTETRLVPYWHTGKRGDVDASIFVSNLKDKIKNDPTIVSDGHKSYESSVKMFFGKNTNFGMMVKQYRGNRYIGCNRKVMSGEVLEKAITTSYVERCNLTMRMRMRRFTRKTNGFSKKMEYHKWALALHFMHYNFVNNHGTIKTTPAIKACVEQYKWELDDIVKLLE